MTLEKMSSREGLDKPLTDEEPGQGVPESLAGGGPGPVPSQPSALSLGWGQRLLPGWTCPGAQEREGQDWAGRGSRGGASVS